MQTASSLVWLPRENVGKTPSLVYPAFLMLQWPWIVIFVLTILRVFSSCSVIQVLLLRQICDYEISEIGGD